MISKRREALRIVAETLFRALSDSQLTECCQLGVFKRRRMSYTENLWLFLLLLFGIIIVPGMDMMFVLANALTGGRRTGRPGHGDHRRRSGDSFRRPPGSQRADGGMGEREER